MRPILLVSALVLAGCNKLPVWKGELEISPRERASIAWCGTGALTSAGTKAISREPYLQSTTTTSTKVVWGSLVPRARVVLTEPGGPRVAAAAASETGASGDIHLVTAELTGLEPAHVYCYQLFADDIALTEPAPLATAAPPHPTEHIQFIAVGDGGTGGDAQRAIAARISTQPFDLILFLGDVAYMSGTAEELQDHFFAVYRDLLRFVPAFPVMGNHERRTNHGRPFLDAFVLPEPERYYSFDWGNVHFIALDTTQPDSRQLTWLADDLRRNSLPWVIVFSHHPMYSNSLRGPQPRIQRTFKRIFSEHEIDLMLAGHEHHYERFLIDGVHHVVSGGGGGQLTRLHGDSLAVAQATVHHFLAFDVSATTLTMKVIGIDGRQIDRLELLKSREETVPAQTTQVERRAPRAIGP